MDTPSDGVVSRLMRSPDSPSKRKINKSAQRFKLPAPGRGSKAKLKKADFDQVVALHPTMSEELLLMRCDWGQPRSEASCESLFKPRIQRGDHGRDAPVPPRC